MKDTLPLLSIELIGRRLARGLSQRDMAERLDADITTVSRWELGQYKPTTKKHIEKIKFEYDLSQEKLDKLMVDWVYQEQKNMRYTIQGYQYLEAYNIDEYALLDRLIEIDTAVMPDIKREEEGSTDQWAPIFHTSPYTWKLLTRGEEIAGYWHYLCLHDAQFTLAKQGKLVESSIRPDMLSHQTMSEEGKNYNMFISQIAIDSKHQSPERSHVLIMSFIREFQRLASAGFFFSEVCTVAFTPIGRQICMDFGMEKIDQQKDLSGSLIGDVFHIAGKDIPRRGHLAKRLAVAKLYRERFG